MEMKQEISALQHREALSTEILAALAADQEVPTILQGLQDHDDLSSIVRMIRSPSKSKSSTGLSSESYDTSIASPLECYGSTGASSVDADYENSLNSPADMQAPKFGTAICTKKSPQLMWPQSHYEMSSNACRGPTDLSDHRLTKHLFSVYWVWVHPSHMILNMPRFVQSYEVVVETYCSALLVYAVCIAACKHLDSDWEAVEGKTTDVAELRHNLIANARKLEATVDPDVIPNRQALAILSLVDDWV